MTMTILTDHFYGLGVSNQMYVHSGDLLRYKDLIPNHLLKFDTLVWYARKIGSDSRHLSA